MPHICLPFADVGERESARFMPGHEFRTPSKTKKRTAARWRDFPIPEPMGQNRVRERQSADYDHSLRFGLISCSIVLKNTVSRNFGLSSCTPIISRSCCLSFT